MSLAEARDAAEKLALREIELYGLPTPLHFQLSREKAAEIARDMGADAEIVDLGVMLMDVKLGQAFKEKKLNEHVDMSIAAAREVLEASHVQDAAAAKVLNAVAAHHGKIAFESIEAEIVANADCYRFIHPKGVFHYAMTLTQRGNDVAGVVKGIQAKLEEKHAILTLPRCKEELEPYYQAWRVSIEGSSR